MSDDKKGPGQNESSQEEAVQDNVIRFPVERMKNKRKLKKLAGKAQDNRKTTLFLSLLSVMVLSAYLLQGLDQQTREVASSDNRDLSKEELLARKIQNPESRVPASYGRRPSSEILMQRQLQGYKFDHEEGYLYLAEFNEAGNKAGHVDLEEGALDVFLLKYRDYIYPSYDSVKIYEPQGALEFAEYYELLKAGRSTGYYIEFLFDSPKGGLDSIKVQTIRKP